MISRSLTQYRGTIGITLFLSQAISVAFCIIAFTFLKGFLNFLSVDYGIHIDELSVNLLVMSCLTFPMLTKEQTLV